MYLNLPLQSLHTVQQYLYQNRLPCRIYKHYGNAREGDSIREAPHLSNHCQTQGNPKLRRRGHLSPWWSIYYALPACISRACSGHIERSNFASRLLTRLRPTARFLNVCIYGTADEEEVILSVIHRAHYSIKGDTYSADDPELHK